MKTLLKTLFLLIVSASVLSCARQIPISRVSPESNKTYKVDFLFEHDGCKIYRFQDNGNYVYFTNCKGEITNMISDTTRVQTLNVSRRDSVR